jgi:hypothetical protein
MAQLFSEGTFEKLSQMPFIAEARLGMWKGVTGD